MIFLIFVAGHKNHGKNFLTDLIMTKNWRSDNYKIDFKSNISHEYFDTILKSNLYYQYAFADKLKNEYCLYNNISINEFELNKEKYRNSLQQFSKNKLEQNINYYTIDVYNKIKDLMCNKNNNLKVIFITDYRIEREFEYIYDRLKNENIIIQKWKIVDLYKNVDYDDKWENCLQNDIFDLIFTRIS